VKTEYNILFNMTPYMWQFSIYNTSYRSSAQMWQLLQRRRDTVIWNSVTLFTMRLEQQVLSSPSMQPAGDTGGEARRLGGGM
jgi:hypothetical protein